MNPMKSIPTPPGIRYAVKQTRDARDARDQQAMYREFNATELYCPRCRQAVPVRKRLLLVLPEGDKYEYLCTYCSETVGTKIGS